MSPELTSTIRMGLSSESDKARNLRVADSLPPDIHSSSPEYRLRFRGRTGQYLLKKQRAIFEQLVFADWDNTQPKRFLDLGGGHGQILPIFLQAEFVHGAVQGSSCGCVDLLRKDNLLGDSSNFVVSALAELPFADESFGVISAFRMVAHLNDWSGFIAEMCRVSAYRVVLDFAPRTSFNLLYPFLFHIKKHCEGNTRSFERHTLAEICDVFNRHGFRLRAVKNQYFLPVVVHRVISIPALTESMEKFFAVIGMTKFFGSPTIAVFERARS